MLICLIASLGPVPVRAASPWPQPPATDPLALGLWWLYHSQFEKSYAAFDAYTNAHPQDPAGFFYKSAVSWWHLAQDLEYDLPEVRARFDQDLDRTIALAQARLHDARDSKSRAQALLYQGGAEGLRGRWLVTQREWISAYFAGKRGYGHLREAVKLDPELYDAYLGLGIYDYFTDTLGGVQAVLAALFIRGDKERGLQQLRVAVEKAPHARIEALFFLVEILAFEENQPVQALPLTRQLREELPLSPAAHLAEITTLFNHALYNDPAQWETVLKESEDFLRRSEQETPWHKKDGIWPALYCIGNAHLYGRGSLEDAERYFAQILRDSPQESRWRSFSLIRMGQIADLRGQRKTAIDGYRQVLARPEFWGSHHEARLYLKKPFTRDVRPPL